MLKFQLVNFFRICPLSLHYGSTHYYSVHPSAVEVLVSPHWAGCKPPKPSGWRVLKGAGPAPKWKKAGLCRQGQQAGHGQLGIHVSQRRICESIVRGELNHFISVVWPVCRKFMQFTKRKLVKISKGKKVIKGSHINKTIFHNSVLF